MQEVGHHQRKTYAQRRCDAYVNLHVFYLVLFFYEPVTINGTVDVNISDSSINMPVTVQGTANVYITETIDLPIAVSPSTNNGLSGTITTTGTAQAFTTTSTLVLHFQFKNNSTTNTMSLGTATVQSITLFPQSMFLWDSATGEQQDISTWYVVGTSGDTFAVTYQE